MNTATLKFESKGTVTFLLQEEEALIEVTTTPKLEAILKLQLRIDIGFKMTTRTPMIQGA